MQPAREPMLGQGAKTSPRSSFDVVSQSQKDSAVSPTPPGSQTPVDSAQVPVQHSGAEYMPGMDPPEPPSTISVLKILVRKHFFLARKRRRILTCIWPVLMYGGVSCGLWGVLNTLDDEKTKSLLFALLFPLWICFGIVGVMQAAIIDIVSEKETKMKVIQEIYGLSTGMYWLSWLCYFGSVSLVCVVLWFIFLFAIQPVMANSNPVIVFVIFFVAYLQQFVFAAIMSVLFNTMQGAAATASFLNMILVMLAAGGQYVLRGQSTIVWCLASLLPGVSIFNGLSGVMWAENLYSCEQGNCSKGLTFANMFTNVLYLDNKGNAPMAAIFPAGWAMIMILIDLVLYSVFAWWLESVWQGDYGKAKPLTFCFDPAFMCPRRQQQQPQTPQADVENGVPGGQQVAMSIRNLRKVFGDKVAVDGMNIDIYSAEIFALLGHNGAGKTTAINCIVGLIPPTSGGAVVNGFDVHTQIEDARRQLSICPQDNPFYDVFTVRQHLVFFASLRGVPEALVTSSLGRVLDALGMPEKMDELCKSLSGGQKRRLWVATALIGQSPIVFLDEPTSGMDPSSRRELWDLFIEMKASGRCIMFTTHYLEEADVLADRKAVMARGKIQAIGTSRELKMHYGLGYHLKVEVQAGAATEQLISLVQFHVKSAREEISGDEERAQAVDAPRVLSFTLPFEEIVHFGPMLLDLESKKDTLFVNDYTIAMTSLEEVFMALGRQAEEESGDTRNADFREIDVESESGIRRAEVSFLRSVKALMWIRFSQVINNKRSLYASFIMPLVLLFLAFFANFGNDSNPVMSIGIYAPMSFAIAMIPYTAVILREKQDKIKHVALAQGLPVTVYWFATFCAAYLCIIFLAFVLIALMEYKKSTKGGLPGINDNVMILIIIEVLLYPVGVVLMSFNISLLFSSLEVAMKIMPLMSMFAAMIPTMAVSFLWVHPGLMHDIARIIHIVMSLLNPLYGLPGMVIVAGLDQQWEQAEKGLPACGSLSGCFQSWVAFPLYCAPITIFIYAANIIWQDYRSYRTTPGDLTAHGTTRKDEDVLAEEARIAQSPEIASTEAACYQNLSHTYLTPDQNVRGCAQCAPKTETHAVRGISLGIHPGECFGLLGPNGAGKTTTLSILTGEVIPPTAGNVSIFGNDMASAPGMAEAYKMLGLCPQVDPLWDSITGREHLLFYGRIKGLPEVELTTTVKALLFRLGFDDADSDKNAGTYSGGMKRKLSLGIALIGQSPLLFLDEPSAAVDAGAKRHLWKVIKRRAPTQTVVLTTHSMEEAEALCDRIAIQVKGQLRCLGTPSQIKNKYGSGYQLELFCGYGGATSFSGPEVAVSREREMTGFLHAKLSPEISLIEHHGGHYLYQLPPLAGNMSLGLVFSEMQTNMDAMNIIEYSLAQPSLEQVFIRFAREQDDHGDSMIAEGV